MSKRSMLELLILGGVLVPAFGVAWGTIFLGESLSIGTFVGAALVLVSVLVVLNVRLPRPAALATAPIVRPGTSEA